MANINFDGKEYVIEELSDETKAKIANLQFVERKLSELQLEANALKTARNTYAAALKIELDKADASSQEEA